MVAGKNEHIRAGGDIGNSRVDSQRHSAARADLAAINGECSPIKEPTAGMLIGNAQRFHRWDERIERELREQDKTEAHNVLPGDLVLCIDLCLAPGARHSIAPVLQTSTQLPRCGKYYRHPG